MDSLEFFVEGFLAMLLATSAITTQFICCEYYTAFPRLTVLA